MRSRIPWHAVSASLLLCGSRAEIKAQETLSIGPADPGHYLIWFGENLRPYFVETSLDLISWMDFPTSALIGNDAFMGVQVAPVAPIPPNLFYRLREGAVRPGFDSEALTDHDDTGSEEATIGFPLNFAGQTWTELWVNNNGNVTFDDALSDWTRISLQIFDEPIHFSLSSSIAPRLEPQETSISSSITIRSLGMKEMNLAPSAMDTGMASPHGAGFPTTELFAWRS